LVAEREGQAMTVESDLLSRMYPLDGLQPVNREQVAKETDRDDVARDDVLFRAGDNDGVTFYLLSGTIRGDYPDGRVKRIEASGLQGRYAVGDLQPRCFTATVESPAASVARIDRRFLVKVLSWVQLG